MDEVVFFEVFVHVDVVDIVFLDGVVIISSIVFSPFTCTTFAAFTETDLPPQRGLAVLAAATPLGFGIAARISWFIWRIVY